MKTINLIQTRVPQSAETEIITMLLKRISVWALIILIVTGAIVSGIFYYFLTRQEQLTRTKLQLSQTITENSTKEGLLASIKQRTAQVTKILGAQKPVNFVFDILDSIVPPDRISAVSLDEANTVTVVIHASSIGDAVSITDALVRQAKLNKVRSPQLVSLVLEKDGSINLGVSFVAVFQLTYATE